MLATSLYYIILVGNFIIYVGNFIIYIYIYIFTYTCTKLVNVLIYTCSASRETTIMLLLLFKKYSMNLN